MSAGNPLGYDYRDPRRVDRYDKLIIRHPWFLLLRYYDFEFAHEAQN
jgi:hypothetical protein